MDLNSSNYFFYICSSYSFTGAVLFALWWLGRNIAQSTSSKPKVSWWSYFL